MDKPSDEKPIKMDKPSDENLEKLPLEGGIAKVPGASNESSLSPVQIKKKRKLSQVESPSENEDVTTTKECDEFIACHQDTGEESSSDMISLVLKEMNVDILSSKNMYVICDTNIFMKELPLLQLIKEIKLGVGKVVFYICAIVTKELDGLKKNKVVSNSAYDASRFISNLNEKSPSRVFIESIDLIFQFEELGLFSIERQCPENKKLTDEYEYCAKGKQVTLKKAVDLLYCNLLNFVKEEMFKAYAEESDKLVGSISSIKELLNVLFIFWNNVFEYKLTAWDKKLLIILYEKLSENGEYDVKDGSMILKTIESVLYLSSSRTACTDVTELQELEIEFSKLQLQQRNVLENIQKTSNEEFQKNFNKFYEKIKDMVIFFEDVSKTLLTDEGSTSLNLCKTFNDFYGKFKAFKDTMAKLPRKIYKENETIFVELYNTLHHFISYFEVDDVMNKNISYENLKRYFSYAGNFPVLRSMNLELAYFSAKIDKISVRILKCIVSRCYEEFKNFE